MQFFGCENNAKWATNCRKVRGHFVGILLILDAHLLMDGHKRKLAFFRWSSRMATACCDYFALRVEWIIVSWQQGVKSKVDTADVVHLF